jgi:hypothetical protein
MRDWQQWLQQLQPFQQRLKLQWNKLHPDWRLWLALGGILLLGFVLLIPTSKLANEFGTAFVIAAVYRSLKIKLLRDGFEAAYGYVLPPELKGEMHRVMHYKLLCSSSKLIITIDESLEPKAM